MKEKIKSDNKIKKPRKINNKVLGITTGVLVIAAITMPIAVALLIKNKKSTKLTEQHLNKIVELGYGEKEGHYLKINKNALENYGLKVEFNTNKNNMLVQNKSIALFGQKDKKLNSTNGLSSKINYKEFNDHDEDNNIMHHEDLHELNHNQIIKLKFTRTDKAQKSIFPNGHEEVVEYKVEIINEKFLNEIFSEDIITKNPIVFDLENNNLLPILKDTLSIDMIQKNDPDHYLLKSIKKVPIHEHLEFKFLHDSITTTGKKEVKVTATMIETGISKDFTILLQVNIKELNNKNDLKNQVDKKPKEIEKENDSNITTQDETEGEILEIILENKPKSDSQDETQESGLGDYTSDPKDNLEDNQHKTSESGETNDDQNISTVEGDSAADYANDNSQDPVIEDKKDDTHDEPTRDDNESQDGAQKSDLGNINGKIIREVPKIPDDATTITASMFIGFNDFPKDFKIPDSVTSIEFSAFAETTLPEGFRIPDSVTNIGPGAFSGATLPEGFTIPNSVETIGESAFSRITQIPDSFELPNKIQTLNFGLFLDTKLNANFKIPESVTSIGERVFKGATLSEGFMIPDGVKTIGKNAFLEATWDENLEWLDESGNPQSGVTYDKIRAGWKLVAKNSNKNS